MLEVNFSLFGIFVCYFIVSEGQNNWRSKLHCMQLVKFWHCL